MTNRLMISVAALALITGTGFANAQGTGMSHEAPSAAPAQSAPSEHGSTSERGSAGAQINHDAARPAMKSTQNEAKTPGASTSQRAGEKTPGAAKSERAEDNTQGPKSKTLSTENADRAGVKENTTGQNTKPENRAEENDLNKAGRIDQKMSNESEGRSGRRSETVGQAGAGAKLSTEQRTKITTVIRSEHVAPVEHVNFSISVGTRVPHDVRFHPLPADVVTIYPEWRGYEFILVGDQVVVIDPRSFEIVAVLDA
jgi:predicted outer membrane protein